MIKRILAPLAHRTLSPGMVHSVRVWWWFGSSYFPRLIISLFANRPPQVRGFGGKPGPTHIANQLKEINVLAPTAVCRIMTKHGSDKARAHNYSTVYSALFKERLDQPLQILELGLGTNNPDLPSTMGVFGVPGASHRGWRELFPHAQIYGADIDRRILFQEDQIKTFYCDQLSQSSIRELWSNPELQAGADIIIEDGLHTFEANVSFLEGSLDHLRSGGLYICEDIMLDCVDKWYDRLENVYAKRYPNFEFAFTRLPHGGNWANNILVVRRNAS